MSVYLNGLVTDRGKARGTGVIPNLRQAEGKISLADDDESLTAEAFDYLVHLSKADCGNSAPTVSIETVRDTFPWGRLHMIHGIGRDAEDGSIPNERLVWKSSRDASWRQYGRSVRTSELSPGDHALTFTAIDSGGRRASATKTIHIENNAPRVVILTPEAGESYDAGQLIPFSAQVTDVESGNLTNQEDVLTWSYAGGRVMGTGTPMACSLPAGVHTVTASATDRASTGSATRTITVRTPSGNIRPTVTIQQPVRYQVTGNGAGDCIALEVATAYDAEDGELYGDSIVWSDLMEGATEAREIETRDRTVIECGFSAGDTDTKHTIRVTVTDSDGATGTATQEIYVTPVEGGVY